MILYTEGALLAYEKTFHMIINKVAGVSVSDGELTGTLNVDDYDEDQENITLEIDAEIEMPFAYSTDVESFSVSNIWNGTLDDNYLYVCPTSFDLMFAVSFTLMKHYRNQTVLSILQDLFDNPNVSLNLTNAAELELYEEIEYENSLLLRYLGWISLAVGGGLSFFCKVHMILVGRNDCADFTQPIKYALQLFDVTTDLNMGYLIYLYVDAKMERAEYPPLLWFAFILNIVFFIIPYSLNIYYTAKLASRSVIQNNPSARIWFERHQYLFIFLVVGSGGCIPALNLVSCNAFSLGVLNTGLTSFELTSLSDIRVIASVITENIPMIIVQLSFLFYTGGEETLRDILVAMGTSSASIISVLLGWYIGREKSDAAADVAYYYQLRLKKKRGKMQKWDERQLKLLRKNMNLKIKLKQKIIKKAYTDIEFGSIMVGYVFLRMDNVVIRLVQHVVKEELKGDYQVDEKTYRDKEGNVVDKPGLDAARMEMYRVESSVVFRISYLCGESSIDL